MPIYKTQINMNTSLEHIVIAQNREEAMEISNETDAAEYTELGCTWSVVTARQMTEKEIMANTTHKVKLKPTQLELYEQARSLSAELDKTFNEMITNGDPITKKELRQLIAKRPLLWGRFSAFLLTDTLEEE
jgi:hypothetical protein